MRKIYFIILAFLLTANPAASVEKTLTVEEQKDAAFEVFAEILDISTSSNDRLQVLPKMMDKYNEIIDKYPEAPLAQESHMKLIQIYLRDYSPPDFNKAEMIYGKFSNRYPKSFLRGIVEETMGYKYYKYSEWNRLLNFTAPILDRYADNSGKARPALIFFYAEANYSLGNMKDAEKGYKLVIKLFPDGMESPRAKSRLAEIGEKPK